MFDLDPGKMLLVAVVALVVVGPKELPVVLRSLGRAVGRLRDLQSSIREILDEVTAEADLDVVSRDMKSLEKELWTKIAENPATAMRGTLPTLGETTFVAKPSNMDMLEYASVEMEVYLSPMPDPFINNLN